ncbi:hypothetical protein EU408_11970 [Salmonella enterica subsp. enterica]|uniref:hypothetical protein n=1 Tax=Salmonella enterica TaxID=28901 RepID=UPI0012855FAF|nr:hypothetical protein [Salmonella enterica subsp. enterica serovar Hessarek]ECI6610842.1 hypothetical protein [Salmonella enterica subsp. enterica]EGF8155507.1 hypothetical protein [Salmonella enterica subsp. enterica serovar Enteritidis]EGG4117565.1 hypothetical protein [Salmonella enterica]EIJ6118992.1 hypothetical protein [Salmonella enterica subsp. enterica serovar Rubislaw]
MPLIASYRLDWFRVITEITRSGVSMQSLAEELDVSRPTLLNWKQGAEPRHCDGENLIELWCALTHQERGNLPRIVRRQCWKFRTLRPSKYPPQKSETLQAKR